ncbi:MAG: DUF721 domain-containing protein [Ignavibacteria bacterium]|nr:DUF721 domain-containing protein [Ignavibacteria bacterium]
MDKNFKDINQILNKVLVNYNLEGKVKKEQLFENWQNMLGKDLSDKCKPVKIEETILFLKAKNSAWRNELKLREKDLLNLVHKKIDKKIISKIRFI